MNRISLVCLMASVALAQGCYHIDIFLEITGCSEAGTTVAVGETVTFMVSPIDDDLLLTVGIESGDAEITLSTDGTVVVVPSASGTITIVFVSRGEEISVHDFCTFEASAE